MKINKFRKQKKHSPGDNVNASPLDPRVKMLPNVANQPQSEITLWNECWMLLAESFLFQWESQRFLDLELNPSALKYARSS